jgi:hypothetical protein
MRPIFAQTPFGGSKACVTERPSNNGVPLRVVVALGLLASLLARCITPALPGSMVGIERLIVWSGRLTSLLTLLAATGLVAGIARLGTAIVASPRAPLSARLVAIPTVTFGCMLLLFASFRPLEPILALLLGLSAATVGSLSARYAATWRELRAGALVLGLISIGGLVHVVSRKLTQDASDAANLAAFRLAQWIETFGLSLDLLALALTLVWLRRRSPRGHWLVPLALAAAGACVVLALRSAAPGAGVLSVLLGRGLDELGRGQTSLLPVAFSHLLNVASLLAAAAALLGGEHDLGLVLAGCLVARGALDIPIPALLLELSALYLPFARTSPLAPPPPLAAPPSAPPTPPTSSSTPSSAHADDLP